MSNNLNLPQMTAATSDKDDFLNDTLALIDSSVTAVITVDGSVSATLAAADIQNVLKIIAVNVPSGGTTLVLPYLTRLYVLGNDAGSAGPVTFQRGTSTVVLAAGARSIVHMDGTINGLEAVGGGAGSGAGVTGPTGPTGPAGSGGSGGGGTSWDFSPPALATFPNLVGDTADMTLTAVDDTRVGMRISIVGQPGGDRWIGRVKSIANPNAAWSFRAKIKVTATDVNYHLGGILLYKAGQTDVGVFGRGTAAEQFTLYNQTSFAFHETPYIQAQPNLYEWYGIDFDGTNTLTLLNSADGVLWTNIANMNFSAAQYLGGPPDTIGFGLAPNYAGFLFGLSVPYYSGNV